MAPSLMIDTYPGGVPYYEPPTKHSLVQATQPIQMVSSLAWSGMSVTEESQYSVYLTDSDVVEIEQALAHFKSLDLEPHQVSRDNFALPTLAPKLEQVAKEVHDGKGIVVLKGLNSFKYSPKGNIIIFLGVSCYVGEMRGKQDHMGNCLIHIKNSVELKRDQTDRPAMISKLSLGFHTDMYADMLALQTIGNAEKGGAHIVSPCYTIFNELAATQPEILCALMEPEWEFDTRSLHYTPDKRPLVTLHNGHVIFNFGRFMGSGSTVLHDNCTPLQEKALEVLHDMAIKHQLKLNLEPGDLCYMNNFAILHAREGFEDSEEKVRHLVRLFIRNEKLAWDLPAGGHLEHGSNLVFYDDKVPERWEVDVPFRRGFDVREKFSP